MYEVIVIGVLVPVCLQDAVDPAVDHFRGMGGVWRDVKVWVVWFLVGLGDDFIALNG